MEIELIDVIDIYTPENRKRGTAAVGRMSAKAQEVFNGTDLISVFEYNVGNTVCYAIIDRLSTCTNCREEGYTFEEMERIVEAYGH